MILSEYSEEKIFEARVAIEMNGRPGNVSARFAFIVLEHFKGTT